MLSVARGAETERWKQHITPDILNHITAGGEMAKAINGDKHVASWLTSTTF